MSAYLDYLRQVDVLKTAVPRIRQVEIETNLGCNRRCPYCFLSEKRREDIVRTRRKIMDMDLFTEILHQLRSMDFDGEINLHFYGEPLINKSLSVFVAKTSDLLPKAHIVLYTNGDLLTVDKYNLLKRAGIGTFYITRHDNDIPERLRPIFGRPDVVWDSRATMDFNNRGGFLGSLQDPRVRKLPCIYPALALIITIDGDVLPCSCDFDHKMCFGNIKERHIVDIWRSEVARRFRRDLLEGRRGDYDLCRDCDFYSDRLGVPSAAERFRD